MNQIGPHDEADYLMKQTSKRLMELCYEIANHEGAGRLGCDQYRSNITLYSV